MREEAIKIVKHIVQHGKVIEENVSKSRELLKDGLKTHEDGKQLDKSLSILNRLYFAHFNKSHSIGKNYC